MKKNKVIFFGLGGAGQRYLRLLYPLKKKLKLDFFAFRKINKVQLIKKNFTLDGKKIHDKYKDLKFFRKENEAFLNKGIAVISNPTSQHFNTALKCAKKNMNILVEKPFFCNLEDFNDFEKIIKKKKLNFLVAYQKRYSETLLKFLKILEKLKKKNLKKIYIYVNSFVPKWHPYEDYKNLYACNKQLGGGSLLTECHEFDMILMIFGLPKKIRCKKFYLKKNINVESKHNLIFYYSNFNVYFKINMFNEKIRRIIHVITKKLEYKADLNLNKIYKNNKLIYSKFENNEKDFKKLIRYFFSNKMNISKNLYEAKKNILALQACIKSDKTKKTIHI